MDLIEKYIGEGAKSYVEVKKKGEIISSSTIEDFLLIMKQFKSFKFVQDAIKFYNKKYGRDGLITSIEYSII